MIPLVGLHFGGATLTEYDDIVPGTALLGRPVWSAVGLLRDLELRLGIGATTIDRSVRVQHCSRALAKLQTAQARFYSPSYAADPLGTATTLLDWRDLLIEAGWDGGPVPDGGDRVAVLHEIEAIGDLSGGLPDRLRSVELELKSTPRQVLPELNLTDARQLWSGRWQRVFGLLEGGGTRIGSLPPSFERTSDRTDLGCVQALLRGDLERAPMPLRGDGSLIMLTAETSLDLARSVGALLGALDAPSAVVIRGGDPRPLDFALRTHGLGSQGLDSASGWRPALQVLPLAVELAFEPRDPYRVLELVTLPRGPFAGRVGRALAAALSEAPGIGGRPWQRAKTEITDADALTRIADWLEQPGHDAVAGAPRDALIGVTRRVRSWLQSQFVAARLAVRKDATNDASFDERIETLGVALSRAEVFEHAVEHDVRDRLDLVSARQLVEQVAGATTVLPLAVEQAGRLDVVDDASALRRSRDVVLWWHCVAGSERRPKQQPWRIAELRALTAAGVRVPDGVRHLDAETSAWRNAVLAARHRLVLAVPRSAAGEALGPHPIWDEIVARLHASEADIARVTLDSRDLIDGRVSALGGARPPRVAMLEPLSLPAPSADWRLDPSLLAPATRHSASSLEALVACPFTWVLRYRAGLRRASLALIPRGALLNGKLGHRLVEELHRAHAFRDPEIATSQFSSVFDRLIREEAAVLLRPGMAFELAQLRQQLGESMVALARLLVNSGLEIVDVESAQSAPWRTGALEGRLDLLLADRRRNEIVLDLKWGRKRYREFLENGHAIQLAVYAAARRMSTGVKEMPSAAYFSLSRGSLLTVDARPFDGVRAIGGPSIADTWARVDRTVDLVERLFAAGRVPVTGVARSQSLLETSAVVDSERERYLSLENGSACLYCSHASLCGRGWQEFS